MDTLGSMLPSPSAPKLLEAMNKLNPVRFFLVLLAFAALSVGGIACAQGTNAQVLTWLGTTNDILAPGVGYPLSASASSGLPVTLRVVSGPADIANGVITVKGAGTVWVNAEQSGNGIYQALRVSRSFNVRHVLLSPLSSANVPGYASAVCLIGHFAYVFSGASNLSVFDVSNPTNPALVTILHTVTWVEDAQVVGNNVYTVGGGEWDGTKFSGARLQVIDVADPEKPIPVGTKEFSGIARRLHVEGNHAFVTSHDSGVIVFDVSDPRTPAQVGAIQFPPVPQNYLNRQPLAVRVVGNLAYVGVGDDGLQVLDVSDPIRPVPIGGYQNGWSYAGVQVVDRHAYMTGTLGLTIVDVRDPARPIWRSRAETSLVDRIWLVDGYAYVASGQAGSSSGLEIFDVSNPENPLLSGAHRPHDVSDLRISGDRVYLAEGAAGLQILGLRRGYSQAFVWREPPVEILAPNTEYPMEVVASSGLPATLRVESGPAEIREGKVVVSDVGTVWMTARQMGDPTYLPVSESRPFNVRQPRLSLLGGHDMLGLAVDVQVVGSKSYVATVGVSDGAGNSVGGGLSVFDVSDPSVPVLIGEYGYRHATSIRVLGQYAYTVGYPAGFQIVDISNPTSLVRVGGLVTPGQPVDLDVAGDFAYIADGAFGLQIVDIRDPAKPQMVGGHRTKGHGVSVQVAGNFAYLLDSPYGLQVLDVKDPANPVLVSSLSGDFGDLALVGNVAFITRPASTTLSMVDVSSPAAPRMVGELVLDGGGPALGSIRVVNGYAFVAQGTRVRVVDVRACLRSDECRGIRPVDGA